MVDTVFRQQAWAIETWARQKGPQWWLSWRKQSHEATHRETARDPNWPVTTRRSSWDDEKRKSPASPHSLTWPCNCGPHPLLGADSLSSALPPAAPLWWIQSAFISSVLPQVDSPSTCATASIGPDVPQARVGNKYKQNNPKQNKKILVEKIMLQLNWNAFVLMIFLLFCGVLILSLPAAIREGVLRTPPSPWKKPWEVMEVLAADCATTG